MSSDNNEITWKASHSKGVCFSDCRLISSYLLFAFSESTDVVKSEVKPGTKRELSDTDANLGQPSNKLQRTIKTE